MGSTGEAGRKRRHFSSISPTAATVKKHSLVPLSEDKKLDAAVLQFQNQKLTQKLEAQKIEIRALQYKLCQLKEKQQSNEKSLTVVNNSWEELIDDLESHSTRVKDLVTSGRGFEHQIVKDDGDFHPEKAFLSRLLEKGATESSSAGTTTILSEEDRQIDGEKRKSILHNTVNACEDLSNLKSSMSAACLNVLLSDGWSQQGVSCDLQAEVKKLRLAVGNLHLKHKSLAAEFQGNRDTDTKNKADLKGLKGELENAISELEDSNRNLAIIKVEIDLAKGASFPVLNRQNKHVITDETRDKQDDLQEMELALKELLNQSSSRLQELKHLHEDRIKILRQLSNLQNNLKNVKGICSSRPYLLLKDQLAKSKADVVQYQALYEKLQVQKDRLAWREKEIHMKNELADVLCQSSMVAKSRIANLETEIKKCIEEKRVIEANLEEASRDPGRKEIIAEFKALVSSFPEKMGNMQNQLLQHKETASHIHCLCADVQSVTDILDGKVKEFDFSSSRSAQQNAEKQKLQAVLHDLKEADSDLKLFLEMYRRESTDSREVGEARSSEIKAWAHVQSLKTSLDEHNLELRVKAAIEAEAKAQQRLAAREAEIADLRQKLVASRREKSGLSDVLNSKQEETEAYLSEIETIGQAYDDMQTQNQKLLQEISERDDYNMKLVSEGVQSRQMGDDLLMEKRSLERAIQQTKTSVDFYDTKAPRIEDQLKVCLDQIQRLKEDRVQKIATSENTQKRWLDVRKSLQQLIDTLEEAQDKVDMGRVDLAEMQIFLEKERFERKRVEEDLETLKRKAEQLKSLADGSSEAEKLKQELGEYKEILKCSVCLDKRKEVVITKCFHLFCNPCVKGILETRHRKCPVCSASFGPNDVKPVYI
ncbi:E3 ubiquitin-protein ligase BRE1-like 1 [Olea europaea var. sylvestris]|uniref:E3 ubiquitin-protein ligase BRE1-like 1 n=1 Tax=Olea europaea var. sylvestris TaxID=158386 RepID=UPI000C1CF02B|nr:E3 ubiquitin-protein ligase BRE1-like 1 [Olea europaea var. sylvestris]XP_022897218.1 E3 ubiquitin-protein ligase BRE1-like 1 [Olea europaea var. sylvestris]XP_022897219.1 E3 ubiquitin-protein ligase BRE1-like 1 [Olea europaea var. sylvestris]XP_022897220.1 E3 ubiquitin-protein ligase BRE1-like 1 [Olea europaea var. sylvestris]